MGRTLKIKVPVPVSTLTTDVVQQMIDNTLATRGLGDLADVDLTTTAPVTGDKLTFDATSGLWVPAP